MRCLFTSHWGHRAQQTLQLFEARPAQVLIWFSVLSPRPTTTIFGKTQYRAEHCIQHTSVCGGLLLGSISQRPKARGLTGSAQEHSWQSWQSWVRPVFLHSAGPSAQSDGFSFSVRGEEKVLQRQWIEMRCSVRADFLPRIVEQQAHALRIQQHQVTM